MTSINTRGLIFLFAAFHMVWAFVLYNFSSSIAIWLSEGSFSQIPSAGGYSGVVAIIGSLAIIAALYPQKTIKYFWIPLSLKIYEIVYAWIFITDMDLNKRMVFHMVMNGFLWLILWIVAWRRVLKNQ